MAGYYGAALSGSVVALTLFDGPWAGVPRMGGLHGAAGRALGAGAGRTTWAPLSASVEGRLRGAVPERMPWRKR